jgi:hypothetical protein
MGIMSDVTLAFTWLRHTSVFTAIGGKHGNSATELTKSPGVFAPWGFLFFARMVSNHSACSTMLVRSY